MASACGSQTVAAIIPIHNALGHAVWCDPLGQTRGGVRRTMKTIRRPQLAGSEACWTRLHYSGKIAVPDPPPHNAPGTKLFLFQSFDTRETDLTSFFYQFRSKTDVREPIIQKPTKRSNNNATCVFVSSAFPVSSSHILVFRIPPSVLDTFLHRLFRPLDDFFDECAKTTIRHARTSRNRRSRPQC